jgi:hypothetical protein
MVKNSIEIIFVQLGNDKAHHLIGNIELIKKILPKTKINCVVSEDSQLLKKLPSDVDIFIYKPTEEINNLFEHKIANVSFRTGFWRYSIERLLAINIVHGLRPKASLIHIESDVLLLPGFPLDNFEKLVKIHWLASSINSDIASLIYFPDQKLTEDFTNDMMNYIELDSNPTDMKALINLRRKYPSKYGLLPSTNSNFPKLETFPSGVNNQGFSPNGIFDAASIGMWLTGIDPRNGYGFTNYFATNKLMESKFFVNPSAYPLDYMPSQGLYFTDGTEKLQVYNLHIHSKSKKIFSPNFSQEIEKLVKLSHKKRKFAKLNFRVLLGLLISNYSNKTLLEYLYNSPAFSYFKNLRR